MNFPSQYAALIDIKGAKVTKTHDLTTTHVLRAYFLRDPLIACQGDDQHQNLAINPGPKFTNVLNTGA